MLDLDQLNAIQLAKDPIGQKVVGSILALDYRLPRRTRIVVEGLERLPDERVFFAMNHTDRYNYWPFQYRLWRSGRGFTAAWVKGKYYESPYVAWFMANTNNIPLPSRGYVLVTEYRRTTGGAPDGDTYRALRDLTEAEETPASLSEDAPEAARRFVAQRGGVATFVADFETLFRKMMNRVVELNEEALTGGCDVLVFPQGTRSKRLSRGHIGLMQMAWHMKRHIVPVGCNGSDRLYPGGSPFSKGGRVTYRIGEVIRYDGPELGPHQVTDPYVPFTREAAARHRDAFQAATDIVMDRINDLLDPEYQRTDDASDGVQGVARFVE